MALVPSFVVFFIVNAYNVYFISREANTEEYLTKQRPQKAICDGFLLRCRFAILLAP